ncbi:MAG: Ig-like domain-containing protein [Myxococcaceae bacterium]|nr:Ig-like domain-containing protein [Myxococcaceae bacterium]
MKRLLLVCAVTSLAACHDFDTARKDCVANGVCEKPEAPTLVSTVPMNAATDVATTTGFTFVFSLPMSDATLTLSPAVALQGAVYSDDRKTVTVATTGPLLFGQQYVGTLAGTGQNGVALGGTAQFAFTTVAAPDKTPPKLVTTIPGRSQTNVPTSVTLRLDFDERIKTTSLKVSALPVLDFGTPTFANQDRTVTFPMPAAALQPGTTYFLVVDAEDLAGNALDSTTNTFSFTTSALVAPKLVGTVPGRGQTSVPLSVALRLDFDAPIAPSTLFVNSLPNFNFGPPTFSNQNKTVTFSAPPAPLEGSTSYFLVVDAQDPAATPVDPSTNSFSFTTVAPPDTTAPTIISTAPAASATGVDVRTTLSVTFSEAVNPATALAAFAITPDAGCAMALDPSNTLLSCTHADPLAPDAGYTMTVGTGVKDLAGNALAQLFTSSFTTGSIPDTTRPTIVSTLPAGGTTGATLRQPMVVTFSEPMDQASTQGGIEVTTPSGVSLNYVWADGGTTVTATPTADLPYGANVSWRVGAGARDLAGNTVLSAPQFQFKVRQYGVSTLTPVAGGWGYTYSGTLDTGSTGLFVGDNSSNQTDVAYVTYQLPANALEITNATLQLYQYPLASNYPFAPSGVSIHVDAVPFTAPLDSSETNAAALCIGPQCGTVAACDSPLLSSSTVNNGSMPPELRSATVTKYARAGLTLGSRTFSFRLKRVNQPSGVVTCPDYGTNGDSKGDYVRFLGPDDPSASNRPVFTINYTYP